MARSVYFQYKYPYNPDSTNSRYRRGVDGNGLNFNGNTLYPSAFVKTDTYIIKAKIKFRAFDLNGPSVLNRDWDFFYFNGSWQRHGTFFMPSNGEYTWEGNINSLCQKIVISPATTMGESAWDEMIEVEGLWVREYLTTVDLSADYISRLFTNQQGVNQQPCQVSVNIDGVIKKASKVLVNIDGTIIELPPAYNGSYTSSVPDSMRLYEFTPPTSGEYQIDVIWYGGNHEARLYNSSFTQIHPNGVSDSEGQRFYNGTFTLTGGSLYYISLMHYIYDTRISDSMILITTI